MALSLGYSYSRPELARVIDIYLELNVDFDRQVLKGKAVLTIKRVLPSINEVILDSYRLVISSVINKSTKFHLKYQIEECGTYGNKFTIQLPHMVEDYAHLCKIEIEYETRQNSPALCWLTPEQTAGGTYPFLVFNNNPPFARAIFPCQDTPSVKFTYTAVIITPQDFTVLMSACSKYILKYGDKCSYYFSQEIPIPSYAVIIVVGVLKQQCSNSRIYVWTEKLNDSCLQLTITDMEELLSSSANFAKTLLEVAEKKYKCAYPWDSLHICVLPLSLSFLKIECPCLIFLPQTLIKSIDWIISRNWIVVLKVTFQTE